jgi:hypothetical protein
VGEEDYAPLFDNLSGQQLAADNIVILLVPASYFFLSHSTEIYDFALKGQGKGYALRNGRIFEIEWRRPRPESMLSIVLPGGAPYPLKPGNVWFEVLSDTTTHTFLGTTWDFGLSLPPTPTPTPTKRSKRP